MNKTQILLFLIMLVFHITGYTRHDGTSDQHSSQSPIDSEVNDANGSEINEEFSAAEQILSLERNIEEDRKRLNDLNDKLSKQQQTLDSAIQRLNEIKKLIDIKKQEIKSGLSTDGAPEIEPLKNEINILEEEAKLLDQRSKLSVKARETMRQQIAILGKKLEEDQGLLDQLTGVKKEEEKPQIPDTEIPSTETSQTEKQAQPDSIPVRPGIPIPSKVEITTELPISD